MSMKTRNIAFTLLAGVALLVTSCLNNTETFYGEIGKNDIAFKLGSVQTKAASDDFAPVPQKVATFKMDDGQSLVLEETVVDLNGGPDTKGTPAFTENVLDLYGTFSAVANPNSSTKSLPDAEFEFDSSTNYWTHHYYSGNVWDKAPFDFYLRMPSSPAGVTSAYTYNSDGSTEFDYTSPGTAAGQQDILFTYTRLEDEEDNGKEVVFYHALTGIKFSNFYTNKELSDRTVAKTIIKEVTLKGRNEKGGFKNSGHCKVNSDGTVTWSNLSGNATFAISAGSAPNDTTNYKDSQYGLDTLLNNKATARNINDADGSLTFWVVPQQFVDSTVMISVKFDVVLVGEDGTETTHNNEVFEVSLGPRNWSAGQLHTFTLKPIVVGVELVDEMDEAKFVKSNVEVKNTGNVYEYVRVNLVGNWVGNVQTAEGVYDEEDDSILMGYINAATDADGNYTSNQMVEAWNDKDNDVRGYYLDKNKQKIDPLYTVNGVNYLMYGTFEELTPQSEVVPATSDVNGWVRYDKYYYYIRPIGPSEAITDDLFKSYTVNVSPEFWIPDQWGVRRKAGNVHLVMDLMVQSIPAPVDADGNVLDNDDNEGYIRAWLKALGESEDDYDALLDL